jgi:hypothetical protein
LVNEVCLLSLYWVALMTNRALIVSERRWRLVQLKYPESCLRYEYDRSFPIRGLYYDRLKGCLLKLDFFGSIEPDGCFFGRRKVRNSLHCWFSISLKWLHSLSNLAQAYWALFYTVFTYLWDIPLLICTHEWSLCLWSICRVCIEFKFWLMYLGKCPTAEYRLHMLTVLENFCTIFYACYLSSPTIITLCKLCHWQPMNTISYLNPSLIS